MSRKRRRGEAAGQKKSLESDKMKKKKKSGQAYTQHTLSLCPLLLSCCTQSALIIIIIIDFVPSPLSLLLLLLPLLLCLFWPSSSVHLLIQLSICAATTDERVLLKLLYSTTDRDSRCLKMRYYFKHSFIHPSHVLLLCSSSHLNSSRLLIPPSYPSTV